MQFVHALAAGFLTPALILAISPSTTTLSLTPSGPVAPKTVVTLTAVVRSGTESVSPGLVLFCNASASRCEDSAILGQAQLTASGSASIKTRFGIGSHSIRAIFQGTVSVAGSPSPAGNLSVNATANALSAAVTTIASAPAGFTFTGTVTGFGQPVPTGTVMFRDTTNGNALLGSATLGQQGSYALTQSFGFGIGFSPQSMITGDFNNDGIPDLAIGDPGSAGILIVLGNGDGTFTLKSTLPDGDAESGVVIADVNSDGIADVIAGTGFYNALTVFLGKGDGTFTTGATLPADNFSNGFVAGIATGDFNGDGIPDLAAVASDENSFTSGAVVVLLGNGDGTFTSAPQIAVGQSVGIAVADLNGDGFQDLVLFQGDATISVLLGSGNGTFGAESTVINMTNVLSFAVGDLNGDGVPDIVLTEGAPSNPANGALTVLLGKGDGAFTAKPPFSLPDLSPRIVLADFDGDGKLDLAATDYDSYGGQLTHYVTFVPGNGDGTFSPPASVAVSSQAFPFFAAVGDFNGDGLPDLATEALDGYYDPGELNILLGGHTAFAQVSSLDFPIAGSNAIVTQYSGDAVYAAGTSPPVPVYISPANTPRFSPAPGDYAWTQSITLKDSTPGSSIHYTLDGTTPNASSPLYTSPIEVTWDDTIQALAVAPALGASPVATGVYSIDRPMDAPVFSPPAASYPAPQAISLTVDPSYCSHALCDIYYTLNGATPTTGSTLYTHPIPLTSAGTTTIKAIATSHHFVPGPVASATYTLH